MPGHLVSTDMCVCLCVFVVDVRSVDAWSVVTCVCMSVCGLETTCLVISECLCVFVVDVRSVDACYNPCIHVQSD